MTRYRLYTEDKGTGAILAAMAARGIEGATIFLSEGLWRGKTEPSIVIEILADNTQDIRAAVFALADDIKRLNAQEAVMITIDKNVEVYFE